MSSPLKFTTVGFVMLGVLGLVLVANEKTGPAVIFVLVLMIALLVLSHYQQLSDAMFTYTT